MRYLLDELMSYEEGFTDMLMVDRASSRHEMFMGDIQSSDISNSVVTQRDFAAFQASLIMNLQSLLTPQRGLPATLHGGNLALTTSEGTFNPNNSSVSTSNSLHL